MATALESLKNAAQLVQRRRAFCSGAGVAGRFIGRRRWWRRLHRGVDIRRRGLPNNAASGRGVLSRCETVEGCFAQKGIDAGLGIEGQKVTFGSHRGEQNTVCRAAAHPDRASKMADVGILAIFLHTPRASKRTKLALDLRDRGEAYA